MESPLFVLGSALDYIDLRSRSISRKELTSLFRSLISPANKQEQLVKKVCDLLHIDTLIYQLWKTKAFNVHF